MEAWLEITLAQKTATTVIFEHSSKEKIQPNKLLALLERRNFSKAVKLHDCILLWDIEFYHSWPRHCRINTADILCWPNNYFKIIIELLKCLLPLCQKWNHGTPKKKTLSWKDWGAIISIPIQAANKMHDCQGQLFSTDL